MSWQTYVDDQLLATKIVKYAVICGHDGTVWAKSAGFNVSDNELKVLSLVGQIRQTGGDGSVWPYNRREDVYVPLLLREQGAYSINCRVSRRILAGFSTGFPFETQVVRLKAGTSGCHCFKTKQALIVSYYEGPIVPEQAATVTEKLGEYLIGVGY